MKYNRPLTVIGTSAALVLAGCSASGNEAPGPSTATATPESTAPSTCATYGELSGFELSSDAGGGSTLEIARIDNGGACVEMYDETSLQTIDNFPIGTVVRDVCLQPDKPARLHGSIKDAVETVEGAIPLSEEGLKSAQSIGMVGCDAHGVTR